MNVHRPGRWRRGGGGRLRELDRIERASRSRRWRMAPGLKGRSRVEIAKGGRCDMCVTMEVELSGGVMRE